MKNFEFISHNETETKKFAKTLAGKLTKNDVLVLNGELGAGKTKFTEGFLEFFRFRRRNLKSYIYNC